MSKIERKKRLVKARLQLKVIMTFIGIATVAALFQVILLNRSLAELAEKMPRDGDLLMSELGGIARTNVALSLGFLVPFMLGMGLILTHRIAGPIYRFEMFLEQVISGEYDGPVRIRKGDEFQELCDRINDAVATLESRKLKTDRVRIGSNRDENRDAA